MSEGGDISQFGFEVHEDMKEFYSNYVRSHYIEFGINREAALFWPEIKARIKDNYHLIKEKEFIDWFCTTDFVSERKNAVLRYRIKNFFPLLVKKVKTCLK